MPALRPRWRLQPPAADLPDAEPPILFSPAQHTSIEQDRQQAAALVGLLRERLGSAWREAWLAQGVPGVAREMLPIMLADDPAAALHELQAQMQHALDELRERDPETFAQLEAAARQAVAASGAEEPAPPSPPSAATSQALRLLQTLEAFVSARSWTDSYHHVQAHPELVSDEALALLEQVMAAAERDGNNDAVAFFTEHRDLLRRCMETRGECGIRQKTGCQHGAIARCNHAF